MTIQATGAESLLIQGGRVLDPGRGLDAVLDVYLDGGLVVGVGPNLDPAAVRTIDARGLLVCPGFVDLHTHLREPGHEYKETIESGTRAAAHGGYTTICAMPNTDPAIDNRSVVEYVQRAAAERGSARVLVIGAVSRGREGRQLAEMGELAEAGCIGFSDDGACVADASLMRHALEYAAALGLPIIQHAEDPTLADGGLVHEGWVATRLGLRAQPAAAEDMIVARDLRLAEAANAHLHVAHVSTAGSVAMIRAAKQAGIRVTAEVTPHHLTLTHEALLNARDASGPYDTNARVNPPLRTPADVQACIDGLRDGTIDAVATDHAPHATTDKLCEFDRAAPGMIGLETAFGLVWRLVVEGRLDAAAAVERLTAGPVRALRLAERTRQPALGTLAPGAPADVALIDPAARWTVDPATMVSRGKNTPFTGMELQGRVVLTVSAGKVTFAADGGRSR
jgi:dihydroorotase